MINLIKKIKGYLVRCKGVEKPLLSEEKSKKVKYQDMHVTQMSFMDEYFQDMKEIEIKQRKTQELKLEVQQYLDDNLVDDRVCYDAGPQILYQSSISMDADLLDDMEPTFSQTLFKFIKEKGISEVDCYKNANLDRRLFSKIRSDDDYQPRKNTVFALIIGLKLDLDEAEELLDCAGYSISHSIKFDTIMEYLIDKKVYDILVVNEILDSFGCPILGAK